MSQTNYNPYYDVAAPGIIAGLGNPRVYPRVNGNSALSEIWAVPIPGTPVAGTSYGFRWNGHSTSYTAIATDDQASLEEKLYAAITSDPVMFGGVFVTWDSANNQLLVEGRIPGQSFDLVGINLTPARTQNATVAPPEIPFGRVVGRSSGFNETECTLFSAGQTPLGVAMFTHAIQRHGFPAKAATYRPYDTVNVFNRANDLDGIWCECLETDITPDSPVYAVYAAGAHQGKVSRSSTGNTALGGNATFKSTSKLAEGKTIALVSFNLP